MKTPFSSNNDKEKDTVENIENTYEAETENQNPEVSSTTKVKVIAALLVVGFASYVAYWVQEPTDLRADVLAITQESTSPVVSESSEMMALNMPLTSEISNVVEVSISDFAFEPALIEVKSGTTIKWTNNDTVPHTVTGEDFTSGTLNKGESYEYTFQENGEFSYTCSFHPQMQGKVVVGAIANEETAPPLTTSVEEPDMIFPTMSTEEVMPIENLSPAAPEVTAAPQLTVANESVTSKDLSSGELTAEEKTMLGVHGAATEIDKKILAKSGPEELLYVGVFLGILYFNRKKAFRVLK